MFESIFSRLRSILSRDARRNRSIPERRLGESEQRVRQLAAVVQHTKDFVGIATPDGNAVYVNDAGRAMVGLSADFDVTRTKVMDYIAEEDRRLMLDVAIPAVMRDGRWMGQVSYKHWGGGPPVPTMWNAFTITGPSSEEPEFWVTISPDLRQTEAPKRWVRDSEQRLELALEAGGFAAWEWSHGKSVWTDGVFKLLDLEVAPSPDPALFFERVHADDLPGLQEAWEAATRGEADYDHEFRIVRRDGSVRWIKGIGRTRVGPSGAVLDMFGLNWDITEQRRLQLEQAQTREMYEFFARASSVLGATLEPEEIYERTVELCVPFVADGAVLEILDTGEGPDVHETVAQYPHDLPTSDDSGVPAPASRARTQVPLVTRGDRLGRLTLFMGESGRVFDDRSAAVAREVAQRASIALDNARLYGAAQQASRAKSEFLAHMSHEIRTPLAAVLGYSELLEATEKDPAKSRHIAAIKRNGAFLLEILDDILDLSKIEAEKLDLLEEEVSPRALVMDIGSMMGPRAQEKGLVFQADVHTSVPEVVLSDGKRLRQILVNLVGNAIKFTEEGSVNVEVRYEAEPARLEFEVRDTGIGIPDDRQDGLFSPFAQADSSTSRSAGGTGLGLVISRRLALLLDGDITLESEPGRGSTFRASVTAPTPRGAPRRTEHSESGGRAPSPAQAPLRNRRILVVEDQTDLRNLVEEVLSAAGASVDTAEDGEIAIRTAERAWRADRPYDAILFDMHLPNTDGYEAVPRLREMGVTEPIVALSADATSTNHDRCIRLGCDAFLPKPIDQQRLLEVTADLIERDS